MRVDTETGEILSDGDPVVVEDPTEATVARLMLGVPHNIRGYRQWLLWRYEIADDGNRSRKVPYYVNGSRRRGEQGSLLDRSRMATFDQMIAALRAGNGRYTGAGLAFFADSPLKGADLDHCITNGAIDEGVRRFLDACGTYAEKSPGGQGVHLLFLSDVVSKKNIHPDGYNVELFGDSGFLTVTGNALIGDAAATLPAAERAKLLAWADNSGNESTRRREEQIEYTRGTDAAYIRLHALGMVKSDWGDGRISIRCPFEHEHTSASGRSDTVYFLPHTHGYASGHFHCLHAHCAKRTDADFLAAIGFVGGIVGALATEGGNDLFAPVDAFINEWRAFEYVVKGVVQRGRLYGLTGHGNAGKTAIALLMAVCVAYGLPFAGRRVTQGRVVYFAGENADDIRVRMIALCQALRLDVARLAEWLYIAPYTFKLAANVAKVKEKLTALGELAMIVVDTRAAYSSADDENDNVQALFDAKATRDLMEVSGHPAAIVLNHPPHGATQENLRPRGGSSYMLELDGNLTVWNDAGNIALHWNRIRGAPFEPILFTLQAYTLVGYAQPDGDPVGSIIAAPVTDEQAEAAETAERRIEDQLLQQMRGDPNGSERTWGDALGLTRSRVRRLLASLTDAKLVRKYRGRWMLTKRADGD